MTVEKQILQELKELRRIVQTAVDEAVACHETVRQLPCRDGVGCPYRKMSVRPPNGSDSVVKEDV